MDIKEAMEKIWNNKRYTPRDAIEAVSHLNEEVAETMKALMKNENEKAKRELEDALSCMFIAFKMMNLDMDKSIDRQIHMMQLKSERIMIVRKDKVEIFVNGKLKGAWTVWGEEDIREAERMAKDFNCSIRYED